MNERVRYRLELLRSAPHAWSGRRALRREAERAQSPTEIVDAAFAARPPAASIRPVQLPSELGDLAAAVRSDAPRRALEIGTAGGGTLYVLAWACADDARILSLDIARFDPLRLRIYRGFGRRGQRIEVQQADSHRDGTRERVERFFDGEPLDLLFIDGDHAYDAVRDDFERYAPLVRPGGLIALHDIVDGDDSLVGGVPRFWREIRGELDQPRELVESWEQGCYGIGVGRRRPR